MISYKCLEPFNGEGVRISWPNDSLDNLVGFWPTARQDDGSLLGIFSDAVCREIEFRSLNVRLPVLLGGVEGVKLPINRHEFEILVATYVVSGLHNNTEFIQD